MHSTRLLKKGCLLILTIKLSNYKDIFSHFLRHIYNIRLSISIANVPLCDTHRNYIHHAPLLQLLHLVHLQTAELCQSIKYCTKLPSENIFSLQCPLVALVLSSFQFDILDHYLVDMTINALQLGLWVSIRRHVLMKSLEELMILSQV